MQILEKEGYISERKLTDKGEFAAKIFCDEMIISELFATRFYHDLNEYQMLLLLGALVYEQRAADAFNDKRMDKDVQRLFQLLDASSFLRQAKQFKHIKDLTALLYPCYQGARFIGLLNKSTLLEGDVIKFFRQILDRIGQVRKATRDDRLVDMLKEIAARIDKCMEGIDGI